MSDSKESHQEIEIEILRKIRKNLHNERESEKQSQI
jgi:hypothetical protein